MAAGAAPEGAISVSVPARTTERRRAGDRDRQGGGRRPRSFLYRLVRCWTRIMGSMATSSGWIVERPWRRGGDPVATGTRPRADQGRQSVRTSASRGARKSVTATASRSVLPADHVSDVVPDERAGVGASATSRSAAWTVSVKSSRPAIARPDTGGLREAVAGRRVQIDVAAPHPVHRVEWAGSSRRGARAPRPTPDPGAWPGIRGPDADLEGGQGRRVERLRGVHGSDSARTAPAGRRRLPPRCRSR